MFGKNQIYILSGEGNKETTETIQDVYMLRGFTWATRYIFLSLLSYILSPLWSLSYQIKYNTRFLSKKFFLFNNHRYAYFSHIYNYTWKNERAIEIPLVKRYLNKYKNKKILEVGNVFSHYYKSYHDIVDQYEVAKGVINEDIMEYRPQKKYDIIFSISTIEHIGIDGVKDTKKAIKTIQKLKKLARKRGKILFTVPWGYNKKLDKAIWNKSLPLSEVYFFKRVSLDNKWIEIPKNEITHVTYGFPFRWGNVVCFGIIKNR